MLAPEQAYLSWVAFQGDGTAMFISYKKKIALYSWQIMIFDENHLEQSKMMMLCAKLLKDGHEEY